jgi:putative transcriptional regulator
MTSPARAGRIRTCATALLAVVGVAAGSSGRPRAADPPLPAKGRLLVASRTLRDPNFQRTVILLLQYDADGAVGLILNRRSETKVSQLFPKVDGLARRKDLVYLGGPVQTREVFLLVRSKKEPSDSGAVLEDVWVSQSEKLLEDLAQDKRGRRPFHVYVGYAGWGPGQLDAELARGDWRVVPADPELVFEESPARIWRRLVPPADNPWVAALRPAGDHAPGR